MNPQLLCNFREIQVEVRIMGYVGNLLDLHGSGDVVIAESPHLTSTHDRDNRKVASAIYGLLGKLLRGNELTVKQEHNASMKLIPTANDSLSKIIAKEIGQQADKLNDRRTGIECNLKS